MSKHGWRAVARWVLTAGLVVWTAAWAAAAYHGVMADTTLGQSGVPAGGLGAWHVLEVLFVAAHYGVRWLGGVALYVAGVVVLRRVGQPRTVAAAGD